MYKNHLEVSRRSYAVHMEEEVSKNSNYKAMWNLDFLLSKDWNCREILEGSREFLTFLLQNRRGRHLRGM
ncbi:hypothetical protein RchiOBHm_Chr2g0125401 [Rosa chinensis]|uniref:Uncharacterized protein n=1 Tax=Rosa chinensis TaxID=74649 RepID=A0A2P6RTL0_ROSCH|nr:hypothetical protein RchiOBHm_Chr2g0125401 [Rosa chinensis]